MKILILGAGQVGRTAAQALSREEANEVTVVDINEEILRDLQDRLDVRTVAGNASHPTVLEAAGVADADILVALTSSDEVNMVACEMAHHAVPHADQDRAHPRRRVHQRARSCSAPTALSVDVIDQPRAARHRVHRAPASTIPARCRCWTSPTARCAWSGVRARRGGLLVGHALRELREAPARRSTLRVAAIYRDGRRVQPDGDTVIADGDEVFFVAAHDDIDRAMAEMRHGDDPARRIVIAGGGNIGFRLAKTLEKSNQVKLIERDARRAPQDLRAAREHHRAARATRRTRSC